MKTIYWSVFFLMLSLNVCAQKDSKETNFESELIFFKDNKLIKSLENIIDETNSCKNNDWYIDFKNANQIVISQDRIANLMVLYEDNPNKKIYVTTINNFVVFVITNNQSIFDKSRYSINLKDFTNNTVLDFKHFSYWAMNKNYEILSKKIIDCN